MDVYGTTRGSGSGPGKGDRRRPTDEKKFRSNFDEIDWGRKPAVVHCQSCGREIDPDVCWCGQEIMKHDYNDGHSPIPRGCVCGYNDRPAPICCCPNPKPCGCEGGSCLNCGRIFGS